MSQDRYSTIVLNPTGIKKIVNLINAKIQRNLSNIEIQNVFDYVKKQQNANWSLVDDSQIPEILAKNIAVKYFTPQGRNTFKTRDDIVDIQELNKMRIGQPDQELDQKTLDTVNEDGIPLKLAKRVQSGGEEGGVSLGNLDYISSINNITSIDKVSNIEQFLGIKDAMSLQTLLNPSANNKYGYFQADTRFRSLSNNGTNNFTWGMLYNSTTGGQGIINVLGNVRNIVSLRVYPFRMPYQDILDLATQYSRITMLINELSGFSIIGQENSRYHFIFTYTIDGNMLELTPLPEASSAVFRLQKPVTSLDSLTLSFGYPSRPLTFKPDRGQAVVQYTNPMTLVSLTPNQLVAGDLVYISNFTTSNTLADTNAIQTVNSDDGHLVIVPGLDGVTFQIPTIDLSMLVGPIAGHIVDVYFGARRMFIPFEIEYRG